MDLWTVASWHLLFSAGWENSGQKINGKKLALLSDVSLAVEKTVFALDAGRIKVATLKMLLSIEDFWNCYDTVTKVRLFFQ